MTGPYAETLRAVEDLYDDLGAPLPLDIGSRLIAEGHILTDHEYTEE